MSCQYFNISPVLPSVTAIAISKMVKGKRLLASCQGLQSTPVQLLAAVNAITGVVALRDLEYVPYAGPVGPPLVGTSSSMLLVPLLQALFLLRLLCF